MRAARPCINLLLALALFAAGAAGCASSDKKEKAKYLKHVRVHVETRHDIPERSMPAELSNGMRYMVERLPILNENHVSGAAILDSQGGYQVELRFDDMGTRILESYTSAAAGRHLAIMADIDGEGRWVAAPLIRRRIANGVLAFSPAASREDMERLVQGLNREVERRRKQWLN
jgi:preprotein translocase subunit SecD